MGGKKRQRTPSVWALAEKQHGVVTRRQLLQLGYSDHAINHRVARARLHRVRRGVYAVGRPRLTRYGCWMGAVLACGPEAVLSHSSAAALWEIRPVNTELIEILVPTRTGRNQDGIAFHRRPTLAQSDVTRCRGIPVTSPICTLIDLATCLEPVQVERAINEADKRDLTDPEELRSALDQTPRRPGVAKLRDLLDERTFTLTDSELERRFLSIVRGAHLPLPQTGSSVCGFKVDFYWPHLGLVVEADGLRYHRTPAQQAKDGIRDQTHVAAGLTTLRFTHAQVRYQPACVRSRLQAVVHRLCEGAQLG
jgi:very-short-patch-repair endonuclease/predicted transcriptional regulator of viral defense system